MTMTRKTWYKVGPKVFWDFPKVRSMLQSHLPFHYQTTIIVYFAVVVTYSKFASSNTSCLEAHACFFRLLMKGIFDPYLLRPFGQKLISLLVTRLYGTSLLCSITPESLHIYVLNVSACPEPSPAHCSTSTRPFHNLGERSLVLFSK